jgi:hypothetical protein
MMNKIYSPVRWLDEDKNDSNVAPTTTPLPDDGENNPSGSDDAFDVPSQSPVSVNDDKGGGMFGWFLFIVIGVPIGLFILYRLYLRYQYQYEQRMLQYRNTQADRVLGEMQMVPTNEDFDDNELI